jgi:DNA-binding phage protein
VIRPQVDQFHFTELAGGPSPCRGELMLRAFLKADGSSETAHLSKRAKLNRESLYRLLSKRGNPRLSSLSSILDALGVEVHFAPKAKAA